MEYSVFDQHHWLWN